VIHPELPHSLDDEAAVLSSIIRNRDAIVPIAAWLEADHFYREANGWLYAAMLECYKARSTPNVLNVAAALRKADRLEIIGGMDAVIALTDDTTSSYDVEHYARRVVNYAALRRIVLVGGHIAGTGMNARANADVVLADALHALSEVRVSSTGSIFQPLSAAVDAYYEKLDRVTKGEQSALGIQTGYRDLDEITVGLHADELTIIAARPAIGKTAFMLSLAYNIARRGDTDILLCSLEMSRDPLLIRLVAMDTGIDSHRLRVFHLNENEQERVMASLLRMSELPIFIADISAMTTEQIRLATVQHISLRQRPCVAMVDYLQLMGSTRRHENRVQDVSEISRALKNMARELHTPVIALSQLSRAVEGRTSHIPMLSDLRESGSLEQDADNVWFIYRDEVYSPDTDKKGIAELHISKHRNGAIGVIPLHFNACTTRFETLSYRQIEGYGHANND
jgi:replicative DNA helicase